MELNPIYENESEKIFLWVRATQIPVYALYTSIKKNFLKCI